MVAAARLLPGQSALALVEDGLRPADAGMVRAIDAQVASLRARAQPEPHFSIAYLALALGERASSGEADLARVARFHLKRSLSMAPAHPRGWMMVSALRLQDGDAEGAAAALGLSFDVNPHMPILAPFRWPMVWELDDRLGREVREAANLEYLGFFRQQPEAAVRIALRLDRLAELRALAADDGDDRDRLGRVVEKLRYEGA